MQGSLSIEHMCDLAHVSRAGFYRNLKATVPAEEEMEVRSAIQEIVLRHQRRYGYRRVTAELRHRGMCVNHKRVVRLMREDIYWPLAGASLCAPPMRVTALPCI